jgi:hypothetical protein
LTGDYVSKKTGNYSYALLTSYVSNRRNHEMAVNGNTTDEKMANMSYQEQESRIANSKFSIERAHICAGKVADAVGFKPQSFSQDENTYEILDQFNFSYDAGFQAGNLSLSLPGHGQDTWPYPVKNHTFYAVPVSTSTITTPSGKLMIPMSDRVALKNGLNGTEWYNLLIKKYSESESKGSPMVVIFTNFIIGSNEEYLKAYRDFVKYASDKNAKFVTTQQLVDMSKSRYSK